MPNDFYFDLGGETWKVPILRGTELQSRLVGTPYGADRAAMGLRIPLPNYPQVGTPVYQEAVNRFFEMQSKSFDPGLVSGLFPLTDVEITVSLSVFSATMIVWFRALTVSQITRMLSLANSSCSNCLHPSSAHVDQKCIFDTTTFHPKVTELEPVRAARDMLQVCQDNIGVFNGIIQELIIRDLGPVRDVNGESP